jgi:hypothetical protein
MACAERDALRPPAGTLRGLPSKVAVASNVDILDLSSQQLDSPSNIAAALRISKGD